jgi:hypothetical protein
MKRNLLLTNLFLLITAVFFGLQLKNQWSQFQAQNNLLALNTQPDPVQTGTRAAGRPAEVLNYGAIVENLLFSPDRDNIVLPEAPTAVPEQLKPKPILTGIVGLGSHDIALMLPPDAKDNSDYRRLKVGDSIGAYTLVKCLQQKVVMSLDGKEMEIPISEPKNLVAREASTRPNVPSPPKSERVTTLGSVPEVQPPNPAQSSLPSTAGQVPIGTVRQGKVLKSFPTPFGPMNVWVDEK